MWRARGTAFMWQCGLKTRDPFPLPLYQKFRNGREQLSSEVLFKKWLLTLTMVQLTPQMELILPRRERLPNPNLSPCLLSWVWWCTPLILAGRSLWDQGWPFCLHGEFQESQTTQWDPVSQKKRKKKKILPLKIRIKRKQKIHNENTLWNNIAWTHYEIIYNII